MEHHQLEQEIIKLVRNKLAVASLRNVVHRLPKTRSGKKLRKLMRSLQMELSTKFHQR
jgi:acyl-coenzyme A synthetase/AMP-(fatty) acid ligase